MKFEINKFGVAASVTGGAFFLVKHLFMRLMMSGGMSGMKGMMGMMGAGMSGNMMEKASKAGAAAACPMLSSGGILLGTLIVLVIAYLLGVLFAWTYNLMSSE